MVPSTSIASSLAIEVPELSMFQLKREQYNISLQKREVLFMIR
jgi:hypothetical protein